MSEESQMTVAEVARRWRIGKTTVRRRIEDGSLPAVNTNPNGLRARWRIDVEDVKKFERQNRQ